MLKNLKEYALVAEIISAIAVVASLIFVGFQIQQGAEETALNTKAIELSAYQDLIAQISELNTLVIEQPEFATLRSKAFSGESLTPGSGESAQFSAYIILMARHGDLAFRQYKAGLINDSSLYSVLAPLRAMLPFSASRSSWDNFKSGFDPEYVEYIDSMLDAGL